MPHLRCPFAAGTIKVRLAGRTVSGGLLFNGDGDGAGGPASAQAATKGWARIVSGVIIAVT
jgi:hypothetical protein